MTYKELIEQFRTSTEESNIVNTFYYGDIFYLNREGNIKYPVIILTPGTSNIINTSVNNFSFTLTYVDRMTDRRRKEDIHSIAFSELKDITNRLRHYSGLKFDYDYSVDIENSSINFYYDNTGSFADEVTGAYMNLNIELADEVGGCNYGDC